MNQDIEKELNEKIKRQADYIGELESTIDSLESDIGDVGDLVDGMNAKLHAFKKIKETFYRGQ